MMGIERDNKKLVNYHQASLVVFVMFQELYLTSS